MSKSGTVYTKLLTIVISGIRIMGMYVLFICIFYKKQLSHEEKKKEEGKIKRERKNGR